jgi:hypothetical protein
VRGIDTKETTHFTFKRRCNNVTLLRMFAKDSKRRRVPEVDVPTN